MRRGLLLVLLAVGCSSDLSLIRKAHAAYTYAEARYEQRCAQPIKGPPDCPAEHLRLTAYYDELTATDAAALAGPLPKPARTRLKAMPKEIEGGR
jgi:hypothetical protein